MCRRNSGRRGNDCRRNSGGGNDNGARFDRRDRRRPGRGCCRVRGAPANGDAAARTATGQPAKSHCGSAAEPLAPRFPRCGRSERQRVLCGRSFRLDESGSRRFAWPPAPHAEPATRGGSGRLSRAPDASASPGCGAGSTRLRLCAEQAGNGGHHRLGSLGLIVQRRASSSGADWPEKTLVARRDWGLLVPLTVSGLLDGAGHVRDRGGEAGSAAGCSVESGSVSAPGVKFVLGSIDAFGSSARTVGWCGRS